ncbi:MAG: hypothetical protein AAF721_23600 [Myxococcota bacterium]
MNLAPLVWACDPTANPTRILYVDGDETCPGDGTDETPFCDLNAAFDADLEPGDAIRVRTAADPYELASTAGSASGTSDAPIVIESDCGHTPVVGESLTIVDVDYWTVRDLVFKGRGGVILEARTRNVEGLALLDSLFVLNDRARTININGVQDEFEVADARIVGNLLLSTTDLAMQINQARGTLIEANTISGHRCGEVTQFGRHQEGIRISLGCIDTIVRGNALLDFADDCDGEYRREGIRIRNGAVNTLVERNLIRGLPADRSPDARIYAIAVHEDAAGSTITRNVIIDGGNDCALCDGIDFGGPTQDSRWLHNTVIQSEGAGVRVEDSDGLQIANNLIVAPLAVESTDVTAPMGWAGNVYDTSADAPFSWNGTETDFAGWQAACNCDEDSTAAPTLLDDIVTTPPPQSAAVDGGVEGGEPFVGRAPDTGALEAPIASALAPVPDSPLRYAIDFDVAFGPLVPMADCAGLSAAWDGAPTVVSSCASQGDGTTATISFDVSPPQTDATLLQIAYDDGVLADSIGIGGITGARVQAFELELAVDIEGAGNGSSGGDTSDGDATGTAGSGGGSGGGTTGVPGDSTGPSPPGADFPDPDLGCGCRTRAAHRPWALLLLLLGLRRRRPR